MVGERPKWLTFDCYGTHIDFDEGLAQIVRRILSRHADAERDPTELIAAYDRHEHRLEQQPPHRKFRALAGEALRLAMDELGHGCSDEDTAVLANGISAMIPFPEVVDALRMLKVAGYRICIVSNTDEDLITASVVRLAGTIDCVVTAERAGAYKPSAKIFEHAWHAIGVGRHDVVHVCASPHLDLAAARDLDFRCVWIDRRTGRAPLQDYVPDLRLESLAPLPGVPAREWPNATPP